MHVLILGKNDYRLASQNLRIEHHGTRSSALAHSLMYLGWLFTKEYKAEASAMNPIRIDEMDTRWERLAARMEHLKTLDLSDEADLEQALAESQRLLGAIAHCRHLLMQVEAEQKMMSRRAA